MFVARETAGSGREQGESPGERVKADVLTREARAGILERAPEKRARRGTLPSEE